MTTSYLFAYYTLDSQVSLSPCISIKTGLFFFLTFCYIITPISGIYNRSLLHYGKFLKNREKIRTIYHRNHENFKNTNSKSRVPLQGLKGRTVIFIAVGALWQSS